MKKTPLQEIKDRFGSKEKLVKELQAMFDKGDLFVERLNPDKGLARVANAKLLNLHDTATAVVDKFKTREKLVDDLLQRLKRTKDVDFKETLMGWGLPRLWDYYNAVIRKH